MSKPIAQTFTVDDIDVEGVFLAKLRLYFRTKDSNLGISLQIRECDNGVPTRRIVPYSKVYKDAADINVSADSTEYTDFVFTSPVFVRSGEVYAFVLIPDGGSPEYQIWTAKLGENDVSTSSAKPIMKNNEVGVLYISSNDQSWTAVQEEDIKFILYRAEFEDSGSLIVSEPDLEFLTVTNESATFEGRERIYAGNGDIKNARITFSSATGTWSNGELVYQSNGSANTATGILYFSNSTSVKVQNTTGTFIVGNTITGFTSTAFATITAVSQNVITYGTNATTNAVITVPDTSVFAVNDYIYIIHSNTAATPYGKLGLVSSINSTSSTLTLSEKLNFTTNDGYTGKVVGNSIENGLSAVLSSVGEANTVLSGGQNFLKCTQSTANSTNKFTDVINKRLIGRRSGIHYILRRVVDIPYHALSADFKPIVPSLTSLDLEFKGFAKDNSFTQDSNYIDITPGQTFSFADKSRIIMSKSNTMDLPVGRQGNSSFYMNVTLATDNTKLSPYFETSNMRAVFLKNLTANSSMLSGYIMVLSNTSNNYFTEGEGVELDSNNSIYGFVEGSNSTILALYGTTAPINLQANITITANSGPFTNGELVYQSVSSVNTATGFVLAGNTTVIQLVNTTGTFVTSANIVGATSTSTANIASIVQGETITGQTSGTTATIESLTYFNENIGNGLTTISRYISKPVVLADGQDAEDHQLFLTAYRPPETDFYVYGRFLNATDTGRLRDKAWSRLKRVSANNFYSSATDSRNMIELEYGIPTSNQIIANTAASSITGNTITTTSVVGFTANTYIYIYDMDKLALNVRKLTDIPSGTTLQLESATSFAFSGNIFIGTLDGVESKDSAFIFVNPNTSIANTITYSTNDDKIYSSYKTFAIKIIPISNEPYIVPRADDMRALCLQT